ncbi:hypothetical protein RclHR1_01340013 [Rhizophagus clarus]|uniref:Uncharacterized protein n=1 Tax=Rhizophagus clarus TaxID=94130 RepID=A0A2Z6R2F4_9GLOM|nr:hypothetical protein RclHR1_01340013 [Rhizophagus clarus]
MDPETTSQPLYIHGVRRGVTRHAEWAKDQKVVRFDLYLTFSKTSRDQISLKTAVFGTVVIKTYKNPFDSKLADCLITYQKTFKNCQNWCWHVGRLAVWLWSKRPKKSWPQQMPTLY